MPAPTTGSCSFGYSSTSTSVTNIPCNQIVASSTLVTFQNAYVFADTGVLVLLGTGVIVAGLIALMGLGFGIRRLKRYITGRKF